ncbi:hypothetical protein PTT_10109 [Pyrenophora teres f. teres 0-1]|uniref:Uncharacterized protein n=1 Tax=Pyrenophora teres f. teres (strain 0-1) TaxID=861557 RepID=E3RNG4_PYRTT|nr:hypothetical protein PTT_10109 [Pyrenophora teres f. teres 0-1]
MFLKFTSTQLPVHESVPQWLDLTADIYINIGGIEHTKFQAPQGEQGGSPGLVPQQTFVLPLAGQQSAQSVVPPIL